MFVLPKWGFVECLVEISQQRKSSESWLFWCFISSTMTTMINVCWMKLVKLVRDAVKALPRTVEIWKHAVILALNMKTKGSVAIIRHSLKNMIGKDIEDVLQMTLD